MIKKVVHLADIHIRKSLKRHTEFKIALQNTIDSIKEQKPDRIVLVGDLYHDFIDIEGEALVMAGWFLKELSKICQVIITRGNHDFMKKNKNRKDVIKTVVEMIDVDNILYLEETGFYVDENITWTVWHHPDKQGPWKTINHDRVKDSVYVDLFHDPVKSCMTPLGWPLEKGVHITVKDFEGDLGMFGDIHLQQDMDDDSKKAYSGSLIQQTFDEKIYGHGYLIWDIDKRSYEFVEVKSDWKHIEIVLDGEIDYDNLNIDIEETFPHMYFKVKWTDTRNNIHRINQSKIREHLKKYEPLDIKWDKSVLMRGEMEVDDEIRKNINDPEVQRKVFKEYLTEIGYSEEVIKKVLDLDTIISDRLPNRESEFSEYQIDAIWLDNFKSYDDDNLINWKDNNGIIQITGENQVGKTTLLDGICYVLFGKTLSTLKKQKHGDNRFINNKRNLDHCSGWVVLTINEKRYLIKRATGRKMHKNENRVTSVTTEFFIYDLVDLNIDDITSETIEELNVDDALTGDRFLDTQKEIEKSIGTFEDFIRVVMINADNLNDLLSIDRANFIDSIMRYAGYTIFEDKLEEYKEYKKDEGRKTEKIVIDIDFENDFIKSVEKQIVITKESIVDTEKNIGKEKIKIKGKEDEKEALLRDLITIADDLLNFDLEIATSEITLINEKIASHEVTLKTLREDLNNLSTDEEIEEAKKDIESYEKRTEDDTAAKEVLREALSVVENEKKDKESLIKLEDQNKDSQISSLKDAISFKISEVDSKVRNVDAEIKHVLKDAKDLNERTKDLEESKTCSTCGQDVKGEAIQKIKDSIEENKVKLADLKTDHAKHTKELEALGKEKEELTKSLNDIDSSKEALKIIAESTTKVESINKEIELILNKITAKKSDIDAKTELLTFYKTTISNYKTTTTNDEAKKVEINSKINNNTLKIGEYKIEIKNNEANLKLYEASSKSVDHNKKVNEKIDLVSKEIEDVNSSLDSLNRTLNQDKTDLTLKEDDIVTRRERIEKYVDQVALEEVHKIYQKCVHRDGIPTMLLKRSVDVINDEMTTILQDQDYICYFDDELNLMTSHMSKLSSSQHAIESSGKERTFIALALKLALRAINNTSRPDFILLDEMTGKLINESVGEFIIVLDRIKELINKVIIIEHTHPINYDWRIHVEKNDAGVSSCELI